MKIALRTIRDVNHDQKETRDAFFFRESDFQPHILLDDLFCAHPHGIQNLVLERLLYCSTCSDVLSFSMCLL